MRWPWSSHDEEPKKRSFSEWTTDDWVQTFTEPRTLLPSVALTLTTVAAVRFYKSFLRRIPTVNHIKPDYFRRRSLFGKVTSVGDADNFRLFHTPGGRLAGWGLLPWKTVPTKRDDLKDQTLHVRIAGVDAPELAHWGKEAQPFSQEAMDFLTNLLLHKRVRVYLFSRDQYDRIVAQVYIRRWLFFKKDVGLEMLKMGMATVYEAKRGAEFGTSEAKYRAAEEKARERNIGLWTKPSLLKRLGGASSAAPETPREYKTRHAAADKQKKAG